MVVKFLEENVRNIPDSPLKEEFLEELAQMYLLEQKNAFDIAFSKILLKLENNNISLLSSENSPLKRVLIPGNTEE